MTTIRFQGTATRDDAAGNPVYAGIADVLFRAYTGHSGNFEYLQVGTVNGIPDVLTNLPYDQVQVVTSEGRVYDIQSSDVEVTYLFQGTLPGSAPTTVMQFQFSDGAFIFRLGGTALPVVVDVASYQAAVASFADPGPTTDPALQSGDPLNLYDLPGVVAMPEGDFGQVFDGDPVAGDRLLGTALEDQMTGGGGGDRLDGGAGNDRLYGGGDDDALLGRDGDDQVFGDAGDDNIAAEAGNDHVWGGEGDDSIGGGDGNDRLFGGAGNDVIGGGTGNDLVDAGAGDDNTSGGYGADSVYGGDGADTLAGSFGHDIVAGGAGDDSVGGGDGRDTIDGNDGNDTIGGGESDDVVRGGAGDDALNGGNGNDTLFGDSGSDTLNGGGGIDRLVGGADGAIDSFVFNRFTVNGQQTIAAFEDGMDLIVIRGVVVNPANGFAQLDIADTAAGAQISVLHMRILVEGVAASQLTEADFAWA